MSREEKRAFYQRMKKASYREFWEMMNEFHTLAYRLAEKHYQEAMDIVLYPKLKSKVVAKAQEIREMWDGIDEVTVDVTGGDEGYG